MAWHPFEIGQGYCPAYVVEVCERYLNSGAVSDVREKAGYLEIISQCTHGTIYFHPIGGGWGLSPFNLRNWQSSQGSSAFADYRVQNGTRKPWTKTIRGFVYAKTKGHCCVCGILMKQSEPWQIQHIVPFSLGGSDDLENLLPICGPCNLFSSNYTPDYVRRMCELGYALIREVDNGTELGTEISKFMDGRRLRLDLARARRASRSGRVATKPQGG
jgi:5-methylcytosine-specific restriction endonuclease McrA